MKDNRSAISGGIVMLRKILLLLITACLSSTLHAETQRELPTPEKLVQNFAAGNNEVDYIIASKTDLTRYADAVAEILSKGFNKENSSLMFTAMQLAGAIGEKSADKLAPALVPYLLAPYQHNKPLNNLQEYAAVALAKMGAVGIERAAEVLTRHTPELNVAAMAIGAAFRGRGRSLVPLYAKIIDNANGNKQTLECAVEALHFIGLGIDPAAPSLMKIAQDEHNPELALKCLSVIALGAEDLKPYKAALIHAAEDERQEEAEGAILGLFNLGDESPEVIAALKKRALMKERGQLLSVIEVVRYMRSTPAIAFLRDVAEGKHGDVARTEAILGLIDAGVDVEPQRQAINALLKTDEWDVRASAAKVLAKLKKLEPEEMGIVEDQLQAANKMIDEAAKHFVLRRKGAEADLAKAINAETELIEDHRNLEPEDKIRAQANKERQELRRKIPQFDTTLKAIRKEIGPWSQADGFFVWGTALLAKQSADPQTHLLAIWNAYKNFNANVYHDNHPLEALAEFPIGTPALIGEAQALLKESKNSNQRADLAGLLACWNVDLQSQLKVLKDSIDDAENSYDSTPALEWIDRLGRGKAGALTGDIQRWRTDCQSWGTRLYAGIILRRWAAQDKH